jgi:hypothetical protein
MLKWWKRKWGSKMFWLILAVIGAINILFLAILVLTGLLKERRPFTQEEAKLEAIEMEEQAKALREWSFRHAAKKGHKARG